MEGEEASAPLRDSVERRLAIGGLALHSAWTFDVPELFPDPEQYYRMLSFGAAYGEVPSFEEARPALERIFAEYGGPAGLAIRHRRLLWKAVVPGSHPCP
jgi:hypothetical protein